MKLNIPYVTTIVMDYCYTASLVYVCYKLAATPTAVVEDGDAEPPALNPWMAMLCAFYMLLLGAVREMVYLSLLRPYLSPNKTKFNLLVDGPKLLTDIAKTTFTICAIPALSAFGGTMHFCYNPEDGLLKNVLVVSFDYWLINLLKDNLSMRFLHSWMHKPKNYWLHKHHHTGNRNMVVLHGYAIDFVDLMIEFGIGSMIALVAKKYVLGMNPSLHLMSFIFSGWTDSNVHSSNPYTQSIMNPILDAYLKLNICHNLHHAFENDSKYMVVFPYHHLISSERKADIEKYNKIMKTNVDFRIFI